MPSISHRLSQDEDVMDEDDDEEVMETEDPRPPQSMTRDQNTSKSVSPEDHVRKLPSLHTLPSFNQITTSTDPSPSIFPLDSRHRFSISSASTGFSPYIAPGMHSATNSVSASPVFTASSSSNLSGIPLDVQRFSLTSPALRPQDSNEARGRSDREAMAALLMLNSDRRGSVSSREVKRPESGQVTPTGGQRTPVRSGSRAGGGAMSVHDLLSH